MSYELQVWAIFAVFAFILMGMAHWNATVCRRRRKAQQRARKVATRAAIRRAEKRKEVTA